MRVKELKAILEKEKINPVDYDILNKGYVSGFDGYIVENSYKGYKLYYMERGEKSLMGDYESEHEICVAFLKALAPNGDPQLAKYIQ